MRCVGVTYCILCGGETVEEDGVCDECLERVDDGTE